MTGEPPEIAEDEQEIEIEAGMHFWINGYHDLLGSTNQNGLLPFEAVGRWLDERGIENPDNRDTARYLLSEICRGQIQAQNEALEKAVADG